MLADASRDSRLVAEAAARSRRLGRPIVASWAVPASNHDPIALFTQATNVEDRALWLRPSSGEALVGIGHAHGITASGVERFRQVATAWRNLMENAVIDTPSASPVALGGFGFDAQGEPCELWDGFPDARFVLPERTLTTGNGGAWLTTNVVVHPERALPVAPRSTQGGPHAPLSPEEWKALVAFVARGIRDGSLGVDKVVLARAHQVHPGHDVDLAAALRTLASTYPTCTIFAIAHADALFLGATPERLVALRDGIASTMALAGSAPGDAPAEQFQSNPKERIEHAVVVNALRERMADVCTGIVTDAQPRVEKLANVQHLLTRLRGQVRAGQGVLDLVERLHPTPAVGGFPRARALELIRQHEALNRGWYAGPIGWVNPDGQGDFVVGLRSALLRGDTATLFAGCGIVADSDPEAEYTEWGWKLRPMLTALGF